MSPGQTRGFYQETRKDELPCQTCHGTFEGEVAVYRMGQKTREVRPRECPGCRAAREAEERRREEEDRRLGLLRARLEWRRSSGIPEYLQEKTFANFDQRFQRQAFAEAYRWAQGFLAQGARGYPSLILHSEGYGVGKTHLSVAIANLVIDSWEGDSDQATCPVRLESGPGLVRRVRATYNIPREDVYHEREEGVYGQLRGVRLLILDDVGKEKPSEHTREVYWYIIDERMKSGLPMVVTSNLPLEGPGSLETLMGGAAVSRLIGMSGGNYFRLKGEDFRRREKRP